MFTCAVEKIILEAYYHVFTLLIVLVECLIRIIPQHLSAIIAFKTIFCTIDIGKTTCTVLSPSRD